MHGEDLLKRRLARVPTVRPDRSKFRWSFSSSLVGSHHPPKEDLGGNFLASTMMRKGEADGRPARRRLLRNQSRDIRNAKFGNAVFAFQSLSETTWGGGNLEPLAE